MGGIYGHRWTSSYGTDPADEKSGGRMWAAGLFGLTPKQIARGVRACLLGLATDDGWPPSVPQFRELCFNLPTPAKVKAELLEREGKRTPFGLLVGQHLDAFRWRTAEARVADKMLEDAYNEARRHVLTGGELPQVFEALPDDTDREPAPATPEVAAAALAAVREMLDGAPPVLWREDRGLWVAALPILGGREARATVVPPQVDARAAIAGEWFDPWRWRVMVAGEVVHADMEPDADAAKEAAVRWVAANLGGPQ